MMTSTPTPTRRCCSLEWHDAMGMVPAVITEQLIISMIC